jgi:hypothetical protein
MGTVIVELKVEMGAMGNFPLGKEAGIHEYELQIIGGRMPSGGHI